MKLCKDCKYWEKESVHPGDISHLCLCPDFDVKKETNDGISQCGMDAGWVSLATGPEFGCVHWEQQ